MPTHNLTESYEAGGETVAQATAVTAESESVLDVAIASDADDFLVNVAIDQSELKSLLTKQ